MIDPRNNEVYRELDYHTSTVVGLTVSGPFLISAGQDHSYVIVDHRVFSEDFISSQFIQSLNKYALLFLIYHSFSSQLD